jgi:hypothetical protein
VSESLRRQMQELLDAEPPDLTFRARVISSLPDDQDTRTPKRWQWVQGAVAAALAVAIVAGLVYVGRAIRQQPAVPMAITLTQTDSGCIYDGPRVQAAGAVTMQLINHTSDFSQVGVVLLLDNHSYSDLVAHIADEQRRVRAGDSPIGPPGYVAEAAQDEVPPQSTPRLTATLSAGSYGIVCSQSKGAGGSGSVDSISIVGPLTVTSATSTSP